SDAQPGRSVSVNHQICQKSTVLLVGIDIREQLYRPELIEHQRGVFGEVVQIISLESILIISLAHPSAYVDVLYASEKRACARNRSEFGPEAIDDIVHGGILPLLKRFQRDKHTRGIGGRA